MDPVSNIPDNPGSQKGNQAGTLLKTSVQSGAATVFTFTMKVPLYFSQIPERNKDPTSHISVPFYPGTSEYFPVFLNLSSFRQIRIPNGSFIDEEGI